MLRRLFYSLSVAFVYSLFFCSPANCGGSSAQGQPQFFTNEDIARYQTPSDPVAVSEQPAQEGGKVSGKAAGKGKRQHNEKGKKQKQEHEMEYWCKKDTACNRKIEEEKEAIREIEVEIFETKTKSSYSHRENARLEKKLEGAKKRLRKAEAELNDLENEAHRKGAKPGWLRCQT
jgi:peptidoglycan hydrolase CwlO-like protein